LTPLALAAIPRFSPTHCTLQGRSITALRRRGEQPSQTDEAAEFERHVGAANICGSISAALQSAAEGLPLGMTPSRKLGELDAAKIKTPKKLSFIDLQGLLVLL